MVTETQTDPPVPESAYADYEQDLVNEGVPPPQARATRRALERIVDRLMLSMATKSDLRELRTEFRTELRTELRELRADHGGQLRQLLQDVAALNAEMKLLKWMFALGSSAVIGLMSAVLVVLLTRL